MQVLKLLSAVVLVLGLCGFTTFQRSLNDTPWGYTWETQEVRRGKFAQRFELRQGDCGSQPGWSDCQMDRERTEMSQVKPWIDLGTLNWYAWSVRLDPNWRDNSPVTTTLGQFHHRDSSTPAILFVQKDGAWWMRIESAKSLYPGRDLYKLLSLDEMRGQWHDIVVEARFSSGMDGVIRVWVDGQPRVNLTGPNTLGTTPNFFKYGIYRSYVSRVSHRATQVIWYDEIRSGPTRESVDWRLNPRLAPVD